MPTRAGSKRVSTSIRTLHDRCGVYTRTEVVDEILDAIGWTKNTDLSTSRLLEPAAGDGVFVTAAASRLIASSKRLGISLNVASLGDRIRAFEIHPTEAQRARHRLITALAELGIVPATRKALARRWIVTGDFLLTEIKDGSFSHVAGNPPYVRWSRIPAPLRKKYERQLPRRMTRGDLFLPFLDLCIGYLRDRGRLGFVCSDRWRFMAFAENFRRERLPLVVVERNRGLAASDAYLKSVDTYPSILVLRKEREASGKLATPSIKQSRTLREAGYEVRVGPALGVAAAFVLEPDEYGDVEEELLVPWITGSEIEEGTVRWGGRHVIAMHGDDGKLRCLSDYPKLARRLRRHRERLARRSVVAAGAPWYRTIDRVIRDVWSRPKLVLPEIAKEPRLALDESGAIPSHGVYAIFAPDDDLSQLREKLRNGGLAAALENIAPKVKGGYVRCYGRFLKRISIPLSPLP